MPGGQPGLLFQLTGRGERRRLTAEVEQAGGQFPEPATDGMAVLVHQRDVVVVVEGDDGHRAVVLHHLTARTAPAGHPHLVGAQGARVATRDGALDLGTQTTRVRYAG